MAIYFRIVNEYLQISGKTYPVRDKIKNLGASFQHLTKTWQLKDSEDNRRLVSQLCMETGGGQLGSAAPVAKTRELKEEIAAPRGENAVEKQLERMQSNSSESASGDLTITALLARAGGAISQAFPGSVWVVGEIESVQLRPRAIFLTLCEGKGEGQDSKTINATIWGSTLHILKKKLGEKNFTDLFQEGVKIRLLVVVRLYEGRSQLSLQVHDADPNYTKGQLALQREELLRELRVKGLDRANKQLRLPPLPLRIGLITARGSRAYGDFTHQLSEAHYPGQIFFAACSMQGKNTAEEVLNAFELLLGKKVDLIVLTRGGGSAADLRWFDDRRLAYGIAQLEVPLVCAIGHHDDFCVAEEISFIRKKTPTAAAEFLLSGVQVNLEKLILMQHQLEKAFVEQLQIWIEKTHRCESVWQQMVAALEQRLHSYCIQKSEALWQSVALQLQFQYETLDRHLARIHSFAEHGVLEKNASLSHLDLRWGQLVSQAIVGFEQNLDRLQHQIQNHDPKPWMQKGWTQIQMQGKPVRSIGDLKVGQSISMRLTDGRVSAKVDRTEFFANKDIE